VAVRAADWVWLMDDDTIPTPTALEELLRTLGRIPAAVLGGSRVIWTDGSDHPMNTPRENPFATGRARGAASAAGGLAVRSSSFVSMLVSAPAVLRAGLPVADYFIWNDDFDFSTRVLRGRPGMFVPASVVVHKTKVLGSTDVDPGPRFYYEVRNKMWLFLRSRGLTLPEKAVYGASTLVRWVRTVARSADRRMLLAQIGPALRDGIRAPRPNADVLAGLGAASAAITEFERLRTLHG
jgi:GT2 family glycosyltransferase